ncbi:MAG: hypothetical protein NT141_01660 [candidate division WWE3 bacterium]|nr:hypothetical protein [candidate division WWE3 bacterium]
MADKSSKEQAGKLTTIQVPSSLLRGNGSILKVPDFTVTTNFDVGEAGISALQLHKTVPSYGFSSFKRPVAREDLAGGVAWVAVYDYATKPQPFRVVQIYRPAVGKHHIPGDCQAAIVMEDTASGDITFGGIIADGNSNIWLPEGHEPQGVKIIQRKSKKVLIGAAGSPQYAEVLARNAPRLVWMDETLVADFVLTHVDRNPDYINVLGGTTGQMLTARMSTRKPGEMQLSCLCLGATSDLGSLAIPSTKGEAQVIGLRGNDQDVSFQGKLLGYDSKNLVKTLEADMRPIGVLAMTCDGFRVPPQTIGKLSLLEVLQRPADAVVRGFKDDVSWFEGARGDKSYDPEDDGSIFFLVPMPVVEEPVVAATAVTVEESDPEIYVPEAVIAQTIEANLTETKVESVPPTLSANELAALETLGKYSGISAANLMTC